jgi:hypothetical protein
MSKFPTYVGSFSFLEILRDAIEYCVLFVTFASNIWHVVKRGVEWICKTRSGVDL